MRRIRIESTERYLTDKVCAEIRIIDADTGKVMDNVQSASIFMSIDDVIAAHLVCIQMSEDGMHCTVTPDGSLIEYDEDVVVQSVHIG